LHRAGAAPASSTIVEMNDGGALVVAQQLGRRRHVLIDLLAL